MNIVSIKDVIIICSLIFLLKNLECVNGQSLNFLKYDQRNSITKCTHGLIRDIDISTFKTRIDNYQEAGHVKFEIHTAGGKIHDVSTVNFKNPCRSNIERLCIVSNETLQINIYKEAETEFNKTKVAYKNITCENNNATRCEFRKDILWINIYTKAKLEFSNATIRGTMFLSGSDVKRDNQTFPEIYDSSNYTLIINGLDGFENESVCVFNSNGSIPLEFNLECGNQQMTCFHGLVADKRINTKNGTNGTAFTKIVSVNASMEIKYKACSLFQSTSRCVCTWENKDNGINEEQETRNTFYEIGLPIIIILLILFLILVGVLLYRNCKKKSKRNQPEEEVDESELDTLFVDGPQPRADQLHAEEQFCPKILPISSFTINDLPKDYKNEDLVLLIGYISNLTGRLNISYASKERPEFYPGDVDKYPYYDKKGERFQRFANGIVVDVKINTANDEECHCSECRISTSPKRELGKVYFLTARSVIFDKYEAQTTEFKPFDDNNEKENKTGNFLSGYSVKDCDIKFDWCEVECSICDDDFFETLKSNLDNCKEKMKSVNNYYMQQLEPENPRLTIIVCYPSTQPKHVSFGVTTNRRIAQKISKKFLRTNYEYSNKKCEGSAGAFVYVLGVSDISLGNVHVHVGASCSSYGLEKIDHLKINEGASGESC